MIILCHFVVSIYYVVFLYVFSENVQMLNTWGSLSLAVKYAQVCCC